MNRFLAQPNLPKNGKTLLIGEKYTDFLKEPLIYSGISIIKVPDNPFVDPRLSGHADLSVFHAGGNKLFLAPYLRNSSFSDLLVKAGAEIEYLDIIQQKNYPFDAQLNACAFGNKLIYSEKVTSRIIVDYFTRAAGKSIINCRQGYLKCSICVIDENSIITADRGIEAQCSLLGVDVLLISPGYIDLPGFDYGFIGGASFKISDDILAFTGKLDNHPDRNRILEFLSSRSVRPVYLTDLNAFDIGSAIPLLE